MAANPASDEQIAIWREEETRTCRSCRVIKATKEEVVFGPYCDWCRECGKSHRLTKFNSVCPNLYQKTDPARLPQNQLACILAWKYGPKGMILLGETGLGKSRCAWQLIRRIMVEDEESVKIKWFDCVGFGHELSKHYHEEDAEEWLEDLATCPLVFFDDLGKLKLTERAEVELFGVIERRCSNELPIIATTNDTGDSLAARMTDNRGPAMIRRLREFCQPIQF